LVVAISIVISAAGGGLPAGRAGNSGLFGGVVSEVRESGHYYALSVFFCRGAQALRALHNHSPF